MNGAYTTLHAKNLETSVTKYFQTQEQTMYARTYFVLLNKFIESYAILNQYNKQLIDTLINNRDALIKGATVVLPDSGSELLPGLDLLVTESQYKGQ